MFFYYYLIFFFCSLLSFCLFPSSTVLRLFFLHIFSAAQWAGSAHCQTDRGPCQLWSVDWNTGTVFFSLFICPSCILPCAWKHDTVYAITLLSQKNITFLLFFLCFKEHHVLYLLTENTLVSQVFCYLFSPVFMIHSVEFQFVIFTSLSSALLLVKHTVISTGTCSLSSFFPLFCICQDGLLFQRFLKKKN